MTAKEMRNATRTDLDQLVEVYSHPDLKATIKEARWFVRCYFDYHHILVAKHRGKIQGACFWRIEGEERCGLGWVENLWVEEPYRCLGLGERLLKAAVEDMKRCYERDGCPLRNVILTTQAEREVARRLYEKVGFRKVTEVSNLYDRDGRDMLYCLNVTEHKGPTSRKAT